MPRKLKKLEVTAVALVPAGSNPGAHVAFFKADPAAVTKATFNELLLAEQRRKALWKIADSIYTMQDAMYTSIYSDTPSADIRKSIEQFGAYVNKLLDALDTNALDGDADVIKQLVQKKAEGVFARFFNQEPTTMSKTAVTPPVTPPAAETTQPQPVEVNLADLPANIQKMIADANEAVAKANATAAAAQKTADEAKAQVEIERERRETLEFTAIAKAELTHLPGTAEEKGATLREMSLAMPKEAFDKAFTLLKAGAAAMTAQTQESGIQRSAGGDPPSDLTSFFDAEAAKLMEKDAKLTRPVALTKAYKAHPEKYRELAREEENSGRRGSRVLTRH